MPVVDVVPVIPVVDDMPVVGHGTGPVGTTDGTPTPVNGLRPPVASSDDPMGMPTLPTEDRAPGDEPDADGLDGAAPPPAHAMEADPDRPALSNKTPEGDIPLLELPALEVIGCTDPPMPEHAEADVIEPRGAVPAAVGLTPGVASSVAPSGIPVVPTAAPAPMPSGEVTPSEGNPVPPLTCANAGLQHSKGKAAAAINKGLIRRFL